MTTVQIARARQSQIAQAFRAGRAAAVANPGKLDFQIPNPYAERDGSMPELLATVRGAQWHAFSAGILRQHGNIANAGILLRNARFCLRRATELGRA